MRVTDSYMVKTNAGINTMLVLVELTYSVKVRWGNGIEEWIYKSDFKAANSYVDPKIIIIERLNND